MKDHRTYRDGLRDGLRTASKMVKNDVAAINGIMCVVLMEQGNTEEECLCLMQQIQDRWIEVSESREGVWNYLKRKLPFDIVQVRFGEETENGEN